MKKQNLKNLALNKKSISILETSQNLVGGTVHTVHICYKSKPVQGGNLCFKSKNVKECVPNTYQVNTATLPLC